MKKYIGIALAIVIALFVMAMVISGSDGQDGMQYVEANEEYTEKSSFISKNEVKNSFFIVFISTSYY